MRLATGCLLGLLLVLAPLAAPAAAAEPKPLEVDEVLRLIEQAGGLEEYPNANAIVVLDETIVEYDETGAYKEYSHSLTKILTDEGLDRYGNVSSTYHRRYSTLDILAARVIKPDGTVVPVTEDLITDGTPPQLAAIDIYETDFRMKTVVFPNLEIGDAIESIMLTTSEPLIPGEYNGFSFLQFIEPMVDVTLEISGPVEKPLIHAVKDGEAEFTEEAVGDRIVYTWHISDAKQIEMEQPMPSLAQVATRVITSTMHTWEEVSRYSWELTDEKCVADETVKELVAEITEGLETTEEKIKAIHYWIAENVRYLGVSMDRGAFLEPHFASYTIEKEYGVCRDKSVLMITMLKEIGVPAWDATINVSRTTDREIPNVFFEHVIVAIEDGEGGYFYIDPTQETSRELKAHYAGDHWVLHATEEGMGLIQVPHSPAAENSGKITDLSTLEDGLIEGTVVLTGNGMYEEIIRTIARNSNEEQLREMWEGIVQNLYPGAELTSFEISDYEGLDEPMTVRVGYSVNDYALDADPYLLFRVPAATGSFDFLSNAIFGRLATLPERHYPLVLGTTLGMNESAEVRIPDGYVVESFPDQVQYEDGPITLKIAYDYRAPQGERETGLVSYERVFAIDSFQLMSEEYSALREAMRLAERSTHGEVILKKEAN